MSVATSGDIRDQPKVDDATSELRQEVFGKEKSPCRLVYGVASLALGIPVELEIISGWRRKGRRAALFPRQVALRKKHRTSPP